MIEINDRKIKLGERNSLKRDLKIMNYLVKVLLLISLGACCNAFADKEFFDNKSIKCDVAYGAASVVGRNQSAWKAKEIKEAISYTFDNINYENHTARIIGDKVARDVEAFKSAIGITIIEKSKKSDEMLEMLSRNDYITIFVITPVNLEGKGFPVVESRVMYSPMPSLLAMDMTLGSQYFGYCKVLQ